MLINGDDGNVDTSTLHNKEGNKFNEVCVASHLQEHRIYALLSYVCAECIQEDNLRDYGYTSQQTGPGAIVIVIILTLVTIEVHGGELHNVRNTLCGFLLNTYLHMSVCSLGAIENTETLMVEVFIRAFITFIMLLYAWNPKGQMCWRWVPLVLVINFALTHRAREAMVGRASLTLLLHTVAVICVMV